MLSWVTMVRFLAIQHTFSEFFGALEPQFEARGIGFSYLRPVTGQDVAAAAGQFDCLWLLGGAYPVADRAHCPWIEDELRLVAAFGKSRRPVVGLGFGSHAVALAHGGTARAEPAHDAYWTIAHATEAGRDDPLARAVDGRRVLVIANGSVDLPHGLAPIAVDERGRWIAIRPTPLAYGLAFRPELKPGMIEDMIMEDGRPVPDHIGALLEEARARWDETQETTARVVAALIEALDLMQERRKMPVFGLQPVRGDG
jgi:GMP synthase-like glutamine amidotransferase